jgi:hypothetical protein
VLPLAAQVTDHYLRREGELSSSSCGFHPGERQKRRRLRYNCSTMTLCSATPADDVNLRGVATCCASQ